MIIRNVESRLVRSILCLAYTTFEFESANQSLSVMLTKSQDEFMITTRFKISDRGGNNGLLFAIGDAY